jgi:hypothetical protein
MLFSHCNTFLNESPNQCQTMQKCINLKSFARKNNGSFFKKATEENDCLGNWPISIFFVSCINEKCNVVHATSKGFKQNQIINTNLSDSKVLRNI